MQDGRFTRTLAKYYFASSNDAILHARFTGSAAYAASFARLEISRESGEMRRFAGVFISIPNPDGPRETSGVQQTRRGRDGGWSEIENRLRAKTSRGAHPRGEIDITPGDSTGSYTRESDRRFELGDRRSFLTIEISRSAPR